MLALHLLSAFSVAAALVLYGVLAFSGRRSSASLEHARLLFRIAPVASPLIAAGIVLVLHTAGTSPSSSTSLGR